MSSQQPAITDGLLSIEQIVGNKKKQIAPIVPISKTTWFKLVKNNVIPKPVRILGRNYYNTETVKNIVASLSNGAGATV
jgi:hypothetical protein